MADSSMHPLRRRLPQWSSVWRRPLPSLLARGLPIIIATVLSRPLGYIRVALQAWLFGATAAMDAFVVASSVPSILQVVLLSGPLSGILVPLLTGYRNDHRTFNALFNSIFTLVTLVSLGIGGVAVFIAPTLMRLAGPGMAPDILTLATLLFRVMVPMLVLQALLSVCKGTLNALDHYGAPEYAGVVFNIVMIAVALCLNPTLGIVGLALGASLGSVAQLGMQWPVLLKYGVRFRPRLRLDIDLHQTTILATGAFLSTVIMPLSTLVDRALASLLFPGAVAALNYAFLLFLLPASLCVVPLSTVLLTDLASLHHQRNFVSLRRQATSALWFVLLLTVPVAILGVIFAAPVTRLVYEYGRFQAADTFRTAQAVQAYLIGLPFYAGVHLLSRNFYAIQDTMTPAIVGLGGLVFNVGSDVLLMQVFSHWGIALARTLTLLVTAVVLYWLFQRRCRRLMMAQEILPTRPLDSSQEVL